MNARFVQRVGSELALVVLTSALTALLVISHAWMHALLVLAVGGATTAVALQHLARRGALELAWRCPRLDRAGLSLARADAPWSTLVAAESVLSAIAREGHRFGDYFEHAGPEVLAHARRAIVLHRSSESTARDELAAIEASFVEIHAQLTRVLSAVPVAARPAGAPLEELHSRTCALASAMSELHEGSR